MRKYIDPGDRLIHKALLGPNGEAGRVCTDPPTVIDIQTDNWICSEWLHEEVTCQDCRRVMNLPDEPSRGSLLRNNLAMRLQIAFAFIDAEFWNTKARQPDEEQLNPDPNGELATEFVNLTNQFNELIRPFLTLIEKHEGEFGWPEIVNVENENR